MIEQSTNKELPEIPSKKYFMIGEVAEICDLKPHVLRYWEQEFSQLNPTTRRGNRRYYQRQDVLLIRKIRSLLYQEGFTISGAIQQLNLEKYRVVELDKKLKNKANGSNQSVTQLTKATTETINNNTASELKQIREELEGLLKII